MKKLAKLIKILSINPNFKQLQATKVPYSDSQTFPHVFPSVHINQTLQTSTSPSLYLLQSSLSLIKPIHPLIKYLFDAHCGPFFPCVYSSSVIKSKYEQKKVIWRRMNLECIKLIFKKKKEEAKNSDSFEIRNSIYLNVCGYVVAKAYTKENFYCRFEDGNNRIDDSHTKKRTAKRSWIISN